MKKIFFVSIMLIVFLSSVTAITPVLDGGDNALVPGGRPVPGGDSPVPDMPEPEVPEPEEPWMPAGIGSNGNTCGLNSYVYQYSTNMELSPELNTGSAIITFKDHYSYTDDVTFFISNSSGEEIGLKTGSEFEKMMGTPLLGVQDGEESYPYQWVNFPCCFIRHALEALSVEELVSLGTLRQAPYVNEDGNTVYSVQLNIRLLGWADTTERYCPLVWYYGDPSTEKDDWLYLITVNEDDQIYMNADCSSMFRSASWYTLWDVHFSDRMHFERVTTLASAFSCKGYYFQLTNGALRSVDFSNCNLSSLTNTKEMFYNMERMEIVDLSGITSNPSNTSDMFGCKSVNENASVPAYIFNSKVSTLGGVAATTWPNKSVSITLNNELSVGFTFGFEGQDIPVYSVNLDYPDYSSYTNVNNQAYDKNGVTEFRVEGQQAQKFTFKVAASQMTKPLLIKYSLGLSGAKECEQEFVFADIAKQYKTYEGGKYANLMDAMLVYGKYAQLYFGVDIDSLPTELTVDTASVSAGATGNAVQYSYKGKTTYPKAGDGFGIAFLGNSLLCYSEMTVRHSFSLPNGIDWSTYDVSVTGDVICKQGKLDDRLILDITGFPPSDFDREYTVTVTRKDNANESFSITYSPVSYLVGAMKNSNDTKLNDLCAAAYQYHKEAEDLFDAVN